MFYAIKSLASKATAPVEPWAVKGDPSRPASGSCTKEEFVKWAQDDAIDHCFYTPVEGLDPATRVGSNNTPVKLHGLVADYDANITQEMINDIRCDYKPNWVSRTFQNGVRCVWIFEAPVTMTSKKFLVHFLKTMMKKLKLTRMLPGLDETAFRSYQLTYELGTDWQRIASDPIAVNTVWKWMHEAGKTFRWAEDAAEAPEIPLETVHEEVEKQFPGRWVGAFEEGSRGCRFWDPAASNPTAAVVRPAGMQCFSGDKTFLPWGEILGPKFVESYEANRIGAVLDTYYYDGRMYWKRLPEGGWHAVSKEDFRLACRVRYGLSAATSRKDTSSEIDKAMFSVNESKLVAAALPFVHQPEGFVYQDGIRYLNIANCKCMAPADRPVDTWGDGFPWVAEFLSGLLDPSDQLMYLLAWWKRFYTSGLVQEPLPGQALFIVGDVEIGKTLLSTAIIPMTVGGQCDASKYLLGDEKFTSHILSQPVMNVDDTEPASDPRKLARYSSMIKKLVANSHQLYEAKFRDAGMITWMGRVIVTCNMDPESIKVLPNMDMSILDKICLFQCGTKRRRFPSRYDLLRILGEELPYFCRYLKDWKVPEECESQSRFGVTSYHSDNLLASAVQNSPVFTFYEMLTSFIESYSLVAPSGTTKWVGNTTQLYTQMVNHPEIGQLMTKMTTAQLSTYMGQLRTKGFPVEQTRTARTRNWEIPLSITDLNADGDVREECIL